MMYYLTDWTLTNMLGECLGQGVTTSEAPSWLLRLVLL
jgi:hypothetical protein